MAFQTGVADDHKHLMEIVRDFLTSNSALVSAGQNWELMAGPSGSMAAGTNNAVFLRGPGMDNDENVYVSMYYLEDSATENWRFTVTCHGGYLAGETVTTQPISSPVTRLSVWNQPMNYWIRGNGLNFGLVVQISTVFMSGTWGYGLPLTLKQNYRKPMIAAGCMGTTDSWFSQSGLNRFIADPSYNCAFVLMPDNVWRRLSHYASNGVSESVESCFLSGILTHPSSYGDLGVGTNSGFISTWSTTINGKYIPRRLKVVTLNPYESSLFYIEGMYKISGRGGVSAGSIMPIDGVDHLVVQNLYRATFNDYMLMRLA